MPTISSSSKMRMPARYPSRLKVAICSGVKVVGCSVVDGWKRRSRSRLLSSSVLGMKFGVVDVLMVQPLYVLTLSRPIEYSGNQILRAMARQLIRIAHRLVWKAVGDQRRQIEPFRRHQIENVLDIPAQVKTKILRLAIDVR